MGKVEWEWGWKWKERTEGCKNGGRGDCYKVRTAIIVGRSLA